MTTALITGASAGLGLALAHALAQRHWHLVLDARGGDRLDTATSALRALTSVETIVGSVTDPAHRAALASAVGRSGDLDLLVHNASDLGASPQAALRDLDEATFGQVLATNLAAPLQLTRLLLPALESAGGTVLAVTSDAAAEHYAGWGGYGASKAALDHLVGTFSTEVPAVHWYAVDPGDMRTQMHQDAFPGEDISDRPLPETVVPALLRLLAARPPSGRYRAAELGTSVPATASTTAGVSA